METRFKAWCSSRVNSRWCDPPAVSKMAPFQSLTFGAKQKATLTEKSNAFAWKHSEAGRPIRTQREQRVSAWVNTTHKCLTKVAGIFKKASVFKYSRLKLKLILHLFIRNTFLMIVDLISIWKEIWEFTFQNDAELRSRRRSHYVRRVLHVAEESTVVAELSRTQLYRDVPLVNVSDKLNSFFELMWSRESLPIGKVENLQREGKSG